MEDRIAKLEADVQRLERTIRVLIRVAKDAYRWYQGDDEAEDTLSLWALNAMANRVEAMIDGDPDLDDRDIGPSIESTRS
jgi:hypothetical protein